MRTTSLAVGAVFALTTLYTSGLDGLMLISSIMSAMVLFFMGLFGGVGLIVKWIDRDD